MSQNPFVNAVIAAGYISLLVTVIFNSPAFVSDNELGMLLPIIMLSALTFSVALMGYLFFYQPVILFTQNKVKEGTQLFLRTLAAFAGITLVVVLAWFLLRSFL